MYNILERLRYKDNNRLFMCVCRKFLMMIMEILAALCSGIQSSISKGEHTPSVIYLTQQKTSINH